MIRVLILLLIAPGAIYGSQDLRLKAAQKIETIGRTLQTIQDEEGADVALRSFHEYQNTVVIQVRKSLVNFYRDLSDEKISQTLDLWAKGSVIIPSKDVAENMNQILYDPSLQNRDKLLRFQMALFMKEIDEAWDTLQKNAEKKGYQKAFQEISDQFRRRDRQSSDRARFVVFSTILFLTSVEFLVLIPPPLMYAMAPFPIIFFGWFVWQYMTSDPEKTSDFLIPPDDFNSGQYRLIPQ